MTSRHALYNASDAVDVLRSFVREVAGIQDGLYSATADTYVDNNTLPQHLRTIKDALQAVGNSPKTCCLSRETREEVRNSIKMIGELTESVCDALLAARELFDDIGVEGLEYAVDLCDPFFTQSLAERAIVASFRGPIPRETRPLPADSEVQKDRARIIASNLRHLTTTSPSTTELPTKPRKRPVRINRRKPKA